jgi:putative Ca2+/H+ antiporter (TMEM165/GDT1 family)
MVQGGLIDAFVIVSATIFLAELTDKDALLLLALATKTKPWTVFAAGSIAFTITTAIVVSIGSILIQYIPVFWVKISGGAIMVAYSLWVFKKGAGTEGVEKSEEKLLRIKSAPLALLSMILALVILDLAGDATVVLTIVFVAHYNATLVFVGAVFSLISATALETIIGNRLGRILSAQRIRYLSVVLFPIIGIAIILTAVLPASSV